MLKSVLVLGVVVAASIRVGLAQNAACPTNPERRQTAIRFARELNTAEARFRSQGNRFGQLSDLAVVAPTGFQAQLSSDGTRYNFAVKDVVEACHFAVFSDQEGVIYTGEPIR